MNTLNEKELEAAFSAICARRAEAPAPDLWPGVEAAIAHGRAGQTGPYRKLGFAGAFAGIAMLVLLFTAPGFTQNALARLKGLLRGNFSLSLGGSELNGVLISEDGEEKEVRLDGNIVKVRMTPLSEDSVLVALAVYLKQEAGELKLVSKPKIVAQKGKPARITVTSRDGKLRYKFAITPGEAPETYHGSLSKAE